MWNRRESVKSHKYDECPLEVRGSVSLSLVVYPNHDLMFVPAIHLHYSLVHHTFNLGRLMLTSVGPTQFV